MDPKYQMTVVANLLIEGVPVLIGDAVITSGDLTERSITVPTVGMLPPMRRPITAFRRKVYIIDKRLTVAWTGSRLKAEQLISSLRYHIQRRGVTEKELEDFLSSYRFPIEGGDELRLVGWIAERSPRPFWWSTKYPGEIVYDEYDIEGSGREVFRQSFFSRDGAVKGHGLTSEEHVFLICLSGISRLLTLETEQGLPLVHGFGFCYDIVVWSKYRFKYISSYTQVNIDVTYEYSMRGGQYRFRNPILIYNSVGSSAVFWTLRYGGQQNADDSHDLLGIDPIIIRSVAHEGVIIPPKPKFHSKFVCAFLLIVDENGRSIAAPFCITDGAGPGDGMWLAREGTLEVLQLDMGIVTTTYREASRTLGSE
jgi:hypothetical protein